MNDIHFDFQRQCNLIERDSQSFLTLLINLGYWRKEHFIRNAVFFLQECVWSKVSTDFGRFFLLNFTAADKNEELLEMQT